MIKKDAALHREVIRAYQTEVPMATIIATFGISRNSIYRILASHGVTRTKARRFRPHDAFFSELHMERPSYWAGFIAADGCIVNKRQFSISVNSDDSGHLATFLTDIGVSRDTAIPSHQHESLIGSRSFLTRQSIVKITSPQMVHDLNRINIIPKKTLHLEPPPAGSIPHESLHHFLRGYLDGNGWIVQRSSDWKIGFCGSVKFISWVASVLGPVGHSMAATRVQNSGLCVLDYGGSFCVDSILSYLYLGATLFLPRKHERRLKFLEWMEPRRNK